MASNPKRVFGLFGVLALLAAAAWAVGWGAHALLDGSAVPLPSPTASLAPFPTGLSGAPKPLPATPSPPLAASLTPAYTSTPAPTLTPLPPQEVEIVRQDEWLYEICRRHCPGRWPAYATPHDLTQYARETARLNDLPWPDPRLEPGQTLRMPSCPDF